MSIESAGETSKGTGYDAIEELLAEARGTLDQPTALDTMQSMIPDQSAPLGRDEADHRHHLMQEAEFHHLFGKLTRSEIVDMMLEEEARQHAAALATPDQPYAPSHESDIRRTNAYLARKLGQQE
jgi:hypothetical protein